MPLNRITDYEWLRSGSIQLHMLLKVPASNHGCRIFWYLLGIFSVTCNAIDELLIRYSAFARYWRKVGSTTGQYISYL
jgi:hypothetical protein